MLHGGEENTRGEFYILINSMKQASKLEKKIASQQHYSMVLTPEAKKEKQVEMERGYERNRERCTFAWKIRQNYRYGQAVCEVTGEILSIDTIPTVTFEIFES